MEWGLHAIFVTVKSLISRFPKVFTLPVYQSTLPYSCPWTLWSVSSPSGPSLVHSHHPLGWTCHLKNRTGHIRYPKFPWYSDKMYQNFQKFVIVDKEMHLQYIFDYRKLLSKRGQIQNEDTSHQETVCSSYSVLYVCELDRANILWHYDILTLTLTFSSIVNQKCCFGLQQGINGRHTNVLFQADLAITILVNVFNSFLQWVK